MSQEIFNHLCTRLKDVQNFRTKTNKDTTDIVIRGELNDMPVGITVRDLTPNLVFVEVSTLEKAERCTLWVMEDIAEVVADRIRYCILCLT